MSNATPPTKPPTKPEGEFALIQLLPNALTVVAICAGLSAIRFGVQGNYSLAVQLIMVACVLDGLDGRLARKLGSDSALGAELDSLADFLNFGVAPPLLLYFWALQDIRGIGWISVLVFCVCCVMRLARFNVSSRADPADKPDGDFFQGIPSPAGALLVLLPMYLSFASSSAFMLPGVLICLYIVLMGFLLISRIPTPAFKTTRVSRENVKYFLLAVAFLGAAILTYAWLTLIALCVGYIGMVIWTLLKKDVSSDA